MLFRATYAHTWNNGYLMLILRDYEQRDGQATKHLGIRAGHMEIFIGFLLGRSRSLSVAVEIEHYPDQDGDTSISMPTAS